MVCWNTTYWYAVVDILSGNELYQGDSESLTAAALEPGTVYARRLNQIEACHAAAVTAAGFRSRGYERIPNVSAYATDGSEDCD